MFRARSCALCAAAGCGAWAGGSWRTSTIKKSISASRNSYGYPRCGLCSSATQVVKVARPKTMGCLCCVGWVGGQAQGLISQVRPHFLHVRPKSVSRNARGAPAFPLFFQRSWSMSFCVMSARARPRAVRPHATDFSRKTAYSINLATSVRHAQCCACRTHGETLKLYTNIAGSLLDLLAGGCPAGKSVADFCY